MVLELGLLTAVLNVVAFVIDFMIGAIEGYRGNFPIVDHDDHGLVIGRQYYSFARMALGIVKDLSAFATVAAWFYTWMH